MIYCCDKFLCWTHNNQEDLLIKLINNFSISLLPCLLACYYYVIIINSIESREDSWMKWDFSTCILTPLLGFQEGLWEVFKYIIVFCYCLDFRTHSLIPCGNFFNKNLKIKSRNFFSGKLNSVDIKIHEKILFPGCLN